MSWIIAACSFFAGAVVAGIPCYCLGIRRGEVDGIRYALQRTKGIHVPH